MDNTHYEIWRYTSNEETAAHKPIMYLSDKHKAQWLAGILSLETAGIYSVYDTDTPSSPYWYKYTFDDFSEKEKHNIKASMINTINNCNHILRVLEEK